MTAATTPRCLHCQMTGAQVLGLCNQCRAAAGARGRAERIAAGLPPVVGDPAVYARLAAIVDRATEAEAQ